MGNASSKLARKFPSNPAVPWVGSRTDRLAPSQPLRKAVASETKNTAIEMDARDPHFMQKLNQLGPVNADHHIATVSADTHIRHILHTRDVSEQQASSLSATRNRMLASALFDLLEQRKSARSRDELANLASQCSIDIDVLERLALFANTPSIVEGSRRRILEEDGRERFTMLASWKTNLLSDSPIPAPKRV